MCWTFKYRPARTTYIPASPPYTDEDKFTFLVAPVKLIFSRILIFWLLIRVVSHGALESAQYG